MEKTTKSVQHMESTLKDLERQVSAMDKVLKGLGPKVDRLEHRQNNRDRNDAKNGGRGGGAQG
jgi:predicted RNase H-like nuclease (RuvC/YqgF family)